jgi:hypothetical protein
MVSVSKPVSEAGCGSPASGSEKQRITRPGRAAELLLKSADPGFHRRCLITVHPDDLAFASDHLRVIQLERQADQLAPEPVALAPVPGPDRFGERGDAK